MAEAARSAFSASSWLIQERIGTEIQQSVTLYRLGTHPRQQLFEDVMRLLLAAEQNLPLVGGSEMGRAIDCKTLTLINDRFDGDNERLVAWLERALELTF